MFYYPLLIFAFGFAIQDFYQKWHSTFIISTLIILFGINFFSHANFYKTAIWYCDSRTTTILSKLNEIGIKESRKIKIDYSWPFWSSFQYYYDLGIYPNIEIVKNKYNREDLNYQADYYIYFDHSLEKVNYILNNQKILMCNKDIVWRFEDEFIIIYSNIRKK